MEDYLSQLNQQQRDAVTYLDGPQLVIAGAGSGKTRVLTYKIVHLLAHDYEPWRIMALTFTNKAAREMRERICSLVGEEVSSKLWMGTFHSIFSRILRINADRLGFESSYTIYDTTDSKSLIKSIIKDMQLDDKVYKVNSVLNSISMAKNALISPESYAIDADLIAADKRAKRPMTARIYATYCHRCRVANAMDFDDLLYYTNILLRDNPDILHHYQEYFKYILVDEYQDTNFAQHLIVSQLGQQSKNICMVGDDAQSIYSFRGANIRNILNLKKAYPTLATFKLEQNYRSTQTIIDAANALIAKNVNQIPKNIFSENKGGERIEVIKSYSDYEEGYLVANRISQLKMRTGDSFEDFAILYRTNAQSRILEEALRKRNLPYRIYGGLAFYQRKEIKDALAYMRMAINPNDDEALRRIINVPARGIGDTTVGKLLNAAIHHRVSIWQVINAPKSYDLNVNSGTLGKLNGFATLIQSFIDFGHNGANADELARKIISDTRLLASLISETTPESISKQENLQELLNGVRQYVDDKVEQGDETISMADFLGEVSLATDQDTKDDDTTERITLMTIHSAKGLEFGNVFIVGAEEDLIPSSMSLNSPEEIEEERRLMYVAITRAKRFCAISYASNRYLNGQTKTCNPSRFLRDIDRSCLRMVAGTSISTPKSFDSYKSSYHSPTRFAQPDKSNNFNRPIAMPHQSTNQPNQALQGIATLHAAVELREGMQIEHIHFGHGTIIKIDTSMPDHSIVVDFGNNDTRKLLLKYAKFVIS
jgi:DNA helicase-2/ATP-dependent DNA helicase PcrA